MKYAPSDPTEKGFVEAVTDILNFGKGIEPNAARFAAVFPTPELKGKILDLLRNRLRADKCLHGKIHERTELHYTLGKGFKNENGEVQVPCTIYYRAA